MYDVNVDGKLSYGEFTMWYTSQPPPLPTFQDMKTRLGTSDLNIHDLKEMLFRVSHQNTRTQSLAVDADSFHSIFVNSITKRQRRLVIERLFQILIPMKMAL